VSNKGIKPILILSLDVGFQKTGAALFELGPALDTLVHAETFTNDMDKSIGKVVHQDYSAAVTMFQKLTKFALDSHISGLVAELPSGGAQGGRANRCMGIATGMFSCLTCVLNVPFEIYLPHDVECLLGIELKPGDGAKMKKGERTAWKKSRLKYVALEDNPQFNKWPKTQALAEDSYDAAAAFSAARRAGNKSLYWKLKTQAVADFKSRPALPFEGVVNGPGQ